MATLLRKPIKPRSLFHLHRSPAAVAPAVSGTGHSSFSSSSSSSSSGKSPKVGKKLVDRLSAVIDAVHDRKLPPELRGQRNNVR